MLQAEWMFDCRQHLNIYLQTKVALVFALIEYRNQYESTQPIVFRTRI